VEYEIEEALKATVKHKNEEQQRKSAALHNVQNAACGSCGFCTSYLMDPSNVIGSHIIQNDYSYHQDIKYLTSISGTKPRA
jgi:hypothetical protein